MLIVAKKIRTKAYQCLCSMKYFLCINGKDRLEIDTPTITVHEVVFA